MKMTDILAHEREGIYEANEEFEQVIAVTTFFGKSMLNITFEFYGKHKMLVGGIPARGGGWHVQPIMRTIVEKKPYFTCVLTPKEVMRKGAFADLRDIEWTQTL